MQSKLWIGKCLWKLWRTELGQTDSQTDTQTDTQEERQRDIKVKTDGPNIMYINIRCLRTVVVDGPSTQKQGNHVDAKQINEKKKSVTMIHAK